MNRNTKQRDLIYQVILNNHSHPDAETIYQQVHEINPKISKGTVYRNLNILSDLGLINHVQLPGSDRYDFNTNQHIHIRCTQCGNVFDIPVNYHMEDDEAVEENGFTSVRHITVFEGVCPQCNKEKEEIKNENL